jgi:hypothetical protein
MTKDDTASIEARRASILVACLHGAGQKERIDGEPSPY